MYITTPEKHKEVPKVSVYLESVVEHNLNKEGEFLDSYVNYLLYVLEIIDFVQVEFCTKTIKL